MNTSMKNDRNEKFRSNSTRGNPRIAQEGKNFISIEFSSEGAILLDMNEKYGLDLMPTFAGTKPEGKNPFMYV